MSKTKSLGHIMIDLETLGTEANSVISAIAAVEFDLKTGQTGRVFYEKIDLQSALDNGYKIDASTLEWWFKQSKEAQAELFKDTKHHDYVLNDFRIFMNQFNQGVDSDLPQIWGNGISFDLGLLKDAHRFSKVYPWQYWQERDVLTLVSLNPSIKKAMEFEGTAHNALNDCYHQVKYCSKTYQSLEVKTECFNTKTH